jgi:hypothetical protein
VLEEVDEADGIALFPRVRERHVRREVLEPAVERELAVLDRGHDRDAGEALRDRPRPEDRVRRHRCSLGPVGDPVALEEGHRTVLDDGNGGARDPIVRELLREPFVELGEGPGRRGRFRFVRPAGGGDRETGGSETDGGGVLHGATSLPCPFPGGPFWRQRLFAPKPTSVRAGRVSP